MGTTWTDQHGSADYGHGHVTTVPAPPDERQDALDAVRDVFADLAGDPVVIQLSADDVWELIDQIAPRGTPRPAQFMVQDGQLKVRIDTYAWSAGAGNALD